jgi:hypothetical protein
MTGGDLVATFVAICICMVVLAVPLGLLGARRTRRRRAAMTDWALRNGWTAAPALAAEWIGRLPGRNRRGVSLALSGTVRGWPVTVAEYSYTTATSGSDGQTQTTHRYIVVVVRMPAPSPAVTVKPRGAGSRALRAIFGSRAGPSDNDEFNRRFDVDTEDPVTAQRLFTAALVNQHLAGELPHWSLSGHDLVTYQSGRIARPEDVPGHADPLIRVAALLQPGSR